MFKELWKQVPAGFKILWAFGFLAGLTVTGLVIVLLYKLITRL